MRKLLLSLFVVCFGSLLTIVAPVAQAGSQDPEQIVKSTTEQVLGALRQDGVREDPERVYGIIEQMILPHFDFRRMSQWVLGKNWRQANPEEQVRFVDEFRKLLVRTYSTALMEYSDQEITYLPSHAAPDGDTATVKTRVNQNGGPPIPIDYRLYQRDGDWKVFDVAIDGISLVANYRTTFNQEISTNGFAGLIERLASRNQQP